MKNHNRSALTIVLTIISLSGAAPAAAQHRVIDPAGQHALCSSIPNQTDCVAQMCTWNGSACSGTSGTTERIYVGLVDTTNDGVVNLRVVLCRDEVDYAFAGSYDAYVFLDNAATPGFMNQDYYVGGDLSTKTYGNADLIIMAWSGMNPSGACGQDPTYGAMHSLWQPLTLSRRNGHYIDFYGEYDNDTLNNEMADTDTFLHGGPGNDQLFNYDPTAGLYGEDGNDNICSYGTGSSEDLEGGNGVDCLRDYNATAFYISCGGPAIPADILYSTTGDYSSDHSCEGTGTVFSCGC